MYNKFSGIKVIYHLDHIKATLEDKRLFPVHINIDTTNYCNHRCIWCSAYEEQKEKANDIDYDILMTALKAAKINGLKAVTHIGHGEPTLYKRFLDLIYGINDLGIEQGIFTNGDFKHEYCEDILKTFTWVRFSLDSGSTKTHSQVHGTRNAYQSILSNVKTMVKNRKGPKHFTVGIQYALHQQNITDFKKCAVKMKELGVDYFAIKPVINRGAVGTKCKKYEIDPERVQDDIRFIEQLANETFEVLYKPYQFQINNSPYGNLDNPEFVRAYKKCYAPNFEWWIQNNLDVAICGPMKKIVGNLKFQEFESILDSFQYKEVISNIDIRKCYRGCRPHYLNEAMHFLENPDFRIHKNFVG
jgi:MoaA/NifB/PqqE/SkfB family radical SAM enzyme